jgi:hypothetical protein
MLIFKILYWAVVLIIAAALAAYAPADLHELIFNELGAIFFAILAWGGYALGLRLLSLVTGGRSQKIERELEEVEGPIRLNIVGEEDARESRGNTN